MSHHQKISLGILFVPTLTIEESVDCWQHIEGAGFDALWLPDHYYNIYQLHSPWHETWALLAHMAASTAKIKIGTLVSSFIYHNPAQLARQAVTVDHLSKGRLVLGLGAGSSYDLSHSMTGVRRFDKEERHQRFQEGALIVDKLLRGEELSPAGNYYVCKKAQLHPSSVHRPRMPLLLAAHQPRSLKFAARHADIWNTTVGNNLDEQSEMKKLREQIGIINTEMAIAGRGGHELLHSMVVSATHRKIYRSESVLITYLEECVNLGIRDFIFPFWQHGKTDASVQFISSKDQLMGIASVLSGFRRRYNA